MITVQKVSVPFALSIAIAVALPSLARTAKVETGKQQQSNSKLTQHIYKGKISRQIQVADNLLRKGKYDDAAEMYHQALNSDVKDTYIRSCLALAYARSFKLDRADEEFDKVLSQDPHNALAMCGKAQVMLNRLQSSSQTIKQQRDGLLNNAQAQCNLALQTDSTLPEASYTLAQILREQGQLDKAAEAYNNAIKLDKTYSDAYAGLGLTQLQQNQMADAISSFKQAVAQNTSNSSAHYGLGRAYLQQGLVDDAIKELNTSLYQFRNSAPVHFELGKAYEQQGNLVAAVREFHEAVRIKPENGAPYIHIAEIRENRGDIEHAIAELRSGLEVLPNNAELRLRIANDNLRLEKLADAIKDYEQVLNASPGNAQAAESLSRALYLKAQKETTGAFVADNDFEAAETSLARAIQMYPNNLQLRLAQAKLRSLSGKIVDLSMVGTPQNDGERIAYAEALLAQNRFKDSEEQLQSLIATTSTTKQLAALADMSLMIKDLNAAESAYKKLQTMPQGQEISSRGLYQVSKTRDASSQDLRLAKDLARRQQFASAIDKYHSAIFNDPRNAAAHQGLAESLEVYGNSDAKQLREAVTQYKAYQSLTPNIPQKEAEKLEKRIAKITTRAGKLEQELASGKKPGLLDRLSLR